MKKECFRESWRTSTLFYFNLILVDITYCLLVSVHMVNSLLIYLKVIDDDDGHEKTCHFFVLGEQTLATIGGWSIASIVFIQAIPRLKYEKSYMLELNRSSNYKILFSTSRINLYHQSLISFLLISAQKPKNSGKECAIVIMFTYW